MNTSHLQKLKEEIQLLGYSPRTNKSYSSCVSKYLNWCNGDLNIQNVRAFLLDLHDKNLAPQSINQHLNAIKFFYKHVVHEKRKISLKFAKKNRRFPIALSREEIHRIIGTIENKKHSLLIALAYSAGLRVSEIVALRCRDLDMESFQLHVKQGKGSKDRISVFSEKLLPHLLERMQAKSASDWLFESNRGGHLSSRSAQKIFEHACQKAGIQKKVSFHSLRHSFATHLLENAVNIRVLQSLLGHANIKTTQSYTHVSKAHLSSVKSPL